MPPSFSIEVRTCSKELTIKPYKYMAINALASAASKSKLILFLNLKFSLFICDSIDKYVTIGFYIVLTRYLLKNTHVTTTYLNCRWTENTAMNVELKDVLKPSSYFQMLLFRSISRC